MHLNLHTEVLKKALTLSNSKAALHWPLDIVVNDNGRIIYIAEPTFINMDSPIPPKERIQYVKKVEDFLDVTKIPEMALEVLKKQQRETVNALRSKDGLIKISRKTIQKGEFEIQSGVGEVTTYEPIDNDGEFIRYNLNGGDSQAYWHPRHSFELLHSFKGEPSLLMKEVMPSRYAELTRLAQAGNIMPSKTGEIVLAFRDKKSAKYYNGTWNEGTHFLDLHRAESETQIDHFLQSHGKVLGPFIPIWDMNFEPLKSYVVDEDNQKVNMFVATKLMLAPLVTQRKYPTIQRIMDHAIGTGPVQEHFLNWLACVLQHKKKTGTAWILHGTEGTGKGLLVNKVLKPIFERYLIVRKASELQSQFNAWMETTMLAFIDEIEADVFEKRSMEGDLRNAITEPIIGIRRMRTDSYEVASYINFIFSSNKPQPVKLPLGDRRFNVGHYQSERLYMTDKEVDTISSEVAAFANYIMNRATDLDAASSILQTEDRKMIQALSVTSLDEFANDVVTGDLPKLWEYMPDEKFLMENGLVDLSASAYAQLLKRFITQQESVISRDELKLLFSHAVGQVPPGANKFTAYLRHHNIHLKAVWDGVQTVRGIKVEWQITPAQRADIIQTLAPSDRLRKVK